VDTDIIKAIEETNNFTYEFCFNCALLCAKMLTGTNNDRALVRRAVIHILNKWESIPKTVYPLWGDIIEAVGFYPYVLKNNETIKLYSLSDEIRQKNHISDYLPNVYMHSEQKKLSDYLQSDRNVVASAPTSFGKSLLIEELVASQKFSNIVIIQPTLALLDETRLKLKKYNDKYKIIVRTSQEPVFDKGNLFLLTAERVMEYAYFSKIDLFIIDEFYKMSLKRIDERADTLNNAFLKIFYAFNPKFYLLGPNIDNITSGFAEKYNAIFFKTDYSLVDCNVIPIDTKGLTGNLKENKLFELLDEQRSQQTLIYCSSPARARRLARGYLKHLKDFENVTLINLPIIDWLNEAIPKWSLTEELSYGIAIHDGSLPKHIGASIIKYFNENKIRCIFCTSTIIEGVNTSAKNVVIFDGKKGPRKIDYFDYSNIKGRSGRLMEHYVGNVFCFVPIPSKKPIEIDIPFYEQAPEIITNEVLVNIHDADVQNQVRERFIELNGIEAELLKIIKLNGTNINGQMNIYDTLQRDIHSQYSNIAWTQMPDWDNMKYVLELGNDNIFKVDKHGVHSVKQLTRYLNIYRINKSIIQIIQDIYKYRLEKDKNPDNETEARYYDEAIETAFHIYRHWFQFTIPKAFRVVDSLQRYICEKNGYKAGSYSYFVQQLENDFISSNLSILVEYGIPSETIRKIENKIPRNLEEDNVIPYLKANKDVIIAQLMQYERDRIEQLL
jgi:hypothetical protein